MHSSVSKLNARSAARASGHKCAWRQALSGSSLQRDMSSARRLLAVLFAAALICQSAAAQGPAVKLPIAIGLDANLSKRSSNQAGEAVRRGMLIAIEEINEAGGVLGRLLDIVARDNRGIPARGIDNIHELATIDNLVAVFGGLLTPVSLAELPAIHKEKVIYLSPWAAGTHIVDNGYTPNYVFRLSVRDQFAGGFLIEDAVRRGYKRPGLLLWRTGWGRSNHKAISAAAKRQAIQLADVQWFNTGEQDLSPQISALKKAEADVIVLVANAPEAIAAFQALDALEQGERLPVISHWGMTGGRISSAGQNAIRGLDISFLQTFSFFDPPFPIRAKYVQETYCRRFGPCRSAADIAAPVGVAHAYDLVHILKRAIEKAGSTDRAAVRSALEQLPAYTGLVRHYDPPFTSQRHDALDASDFRMARYNDQGIILPRDNKYAGGN